MNPMLNIYQKIEELSHKELKLEEMLAGLNARHDKVYFHIERLEENGDKYKNIPILEERLEELEGQIDEYTAKLDECQSEITSLNTEYWDLADEDIESDHYHDRI